MATLQHTDELYHILEDEICALKILPGEALSENQLCKRFGVSRTPIRSVLQRLEQNRFVQIIPCKGTIVTAIDTGVVDQLIFQRVAVEGMVFRDFVQSCSPMEILAVEHLYNMLLEAAAGRSDPENFDFNHFLSCDLAMHEYWFHKTSKEYLWEQMTPRRQTTPALSVWTSWVHATCPASSASTPRCCASCVRRIWTPSSR